MPTSTALTRPPHPAVTSGHRGWAISGGCSIRVWPRPARAPCSGPASGRDASPWSPTHQFYIAALSLVLALAAFGAYLLWRDVHRELRIAALRSQFVSSVSHELKTPLTAVRMFAETLRMGRPADPVRRDEYLDIIVNESERLTRLLDNVLDFSRIESGRKIYQRRAPARSSRATTCSTRSGATT